MRPERFRARFTGGRIDLGRNYLRQEWFDAGLEEFVTKNLLPLHAKKGSAASCFIHVVSMALSKYQAFIYIQFGRFQSYITNLVKTHHTGASRTAFMNQKPRSGMPAFWSYKWFLQVPWPYLMCVQVNTNLLRSCLKVQWTRFDIHKV